MCNWLSEKYSRTFKIRAFPKDWKKGVIVSLHKGKSEKIDYKNYRGISLLNVVEKVYERILIRV